MLRVGRFVDGRGSAIGSCSGAYIRARNLLVRISW
jgi:hypothetical protein